MGPTSESGERYKRGKLKTKRRGLAKTRQNRQRLSALVTSRLLGFEGILV
jgi:hypothetical protein